MDESRPKCEGSACRGEGEPRYGVEVFGEPDRLALLCETCASCFCPEARAHFVPLDGSDLEWPEELEVR
jgi:hypothetical protein